MTKLSELTSITALTPDDEFVITNDPLGTPATRRITRANVSKSMSGVYNVMDYGATANGTTDDSAAFQAAIDAMDTDKGGVLLVPAGRYYMASGVDLNDFTGSDCSLAVQMWGAELWTNQAISIFYANVADNTEANNKIGRKLTFWGGVLKGDNSTSGQKGIEIDAMYNGAVSYTEFINIDVGLELSFCLNTQVSFCRATNCGTYSFVAQSGTGKWTGAGVNTSQSNQTTFYGCRVYGSAGETAQFYLSAASGVQIVDCICEGFDPVNCIEYDALNATTVKDLRIINLHNECTPTNAMIKYDGNGGYLLLDGVFFANSVPYVIDVDGAAQCTIDVRNLANASWTNAIIKNSPASGTFFYFGPGGWGDTYDATDQSATDVFGGGYPSGSNAVQYYGAEIRAPSFIIGSPDYANVANPWIQIRGFLMPRDDDNVKGGLGGPSRRWNDLYIGTGTCSIDTDIDLNGNALDDACFQSTTAANIANAAASFNTTNKAVGRFLWDTTNNRLMIASGSNATDPWYVADGSTSVTPS